MIIIEEYEEYHPNDIIIIESLTYYKLLLTVIFKKDID